MVSLCHSIYTDVWTHRDMHGKGMDAATAPLGEADQALVELARRTAHTLYAGVEVAHRSCGIALAETFGLPSRPYQALRRGGLTGAGECGAIKAGELVLGELLGDPDPAGAPTASLRAAVTWYQEAWHQRLDLGPGHAGGVDVICNSLVRRFADFAGAERREFCTSIAASVAALVAEALIRAGQPPTIAPLPPR
jgi:hypothetical protein